MVLQGPYINFDPLTGLCLFVGFTPLCISAVFLWYYFRLAYSSKEDESQRLKPGEYIIAWFYIIKQNAWLIAVGNMVLITLLSGNDLFYCTGTMQFGGNIDYYLTVNLKTFDDNNAISAAETTNSFNLVASGYSPLTVRI